MSYLGLVALIFMGFMFVFGFYNEIAVHRLIKSMLSGGLVDSALLEELEVANRRSIVRYRRRINWLMRRWRDLPETLVAKARRIVIVEYLVWSSAAMMLISGLVGSLFQEGYI